MGKYIAQSDVENVYGVGNVATWSDLGDSDEAVADTARIALAIAWAEKRVENRFRGSRYTVPFELGTSTIDDQLKQWCAVYAGHWLYASRDISRGDPETGRTDHQISTIEAEISEVLAGQSTLDAASAAPSTPSGPVAITRDMTFGANAYVGMSNPPIAGGEL